MKAEHPLEREVSLVIGAMPFLWLEAGDAPGPTSYRAVIEANAVGLLSNYQSPRVDGASSGWLGHLASSPEIRESGLWNVDFVARVHDRDFLGVMARLVAGETVC